ncbi:hypothetical protein SAMN04487895_104201 [Paenibacillus sophorae]|uniref:Uncharacterized protein n=1 Tax=Paenibacillus sophorae TaxID=1333845 RepID=A0A1H8L7P0_9BACL|nr:hypothetical protein [Paenibacillus sophorae]QWU17412.1 hypothetical protein KP014_09790 [Paenibacillus sophorae]SEO00728.1 hypothetical protein SAMN04487895_104201 [Paenibacillus sophorae]
MKYKKKLNYLYRVWMHKYLIWTKNNVKLAYLLLLFSILFIFQISDIIGPENTITLMKPVWIITLFVIGVDAAFSFLFSNVNEYLAVNRFTGTLSMRSDININFIQLTHRSTGVGRDVLISLAFEDGIEEIKRIHTKTKIRKLLLPFLFYKKNLFTKTNDAIYSVFAKKYKFNYKEIESKAIGEKLLFMTDIQIKVALTEPKKKNKSEKQYQKEKRNHERWKAHLLKEVKCYRINIPIKEIEINEN